MIYLDNNATTKVHPEVFQAMEPYLRDEFGNPSTGYDLGKRSNEAINKAREQVSSFLNANEEEIVFTSCGTESDNAAIYSALNANTEKRHIVTTSVEHSAIILFAKSMMPNIEITELEVNSDGVIDLNELENAIRKDTALVTIMWANNETGICQPIHDAAKIVQEKNTLFHTDAVNAAGKIIIDTNKSPIDFLSISGHKFHAPKGVGALFVRSGSPFSPFLIGGGQENGKRAGTEAVAQIVGLGKAAELAQQRISSDGTEKLASLRDRLEKNIFEKIEGIHHNGCQKRRLPNTSHLSFENVDAGDLLILTNEKGLCIASGSACSTGKREPSRIMKAMGYDDERAMSSVRLSVSSMNTEKEIDEASEIIVSCVKKIRSLRPKDGGPVIFAS